MSVVVCGGPEPRTQAACYGGCYEWCFASGWCSTAEADLTAKQRNEILRFQRRSGGCIPNDLRTLADFGLSPAMLAAAVSDDVLHLMGANHPTAKALQRRGLVDWWAWEGCPPHWHRMGETQAIEELAAAEQGLSYEWKPCFCLNRERSAS